MANPERIRRVGLYFERAFVAAILLSVLWSIDYLLREGQLPIPYYHGNDTFMDWINSAYSAHNPGAYYSFKSVYPPLSFDVLNILSPARCYRFDNLYNRECDWMFPWIMGATFILNIVLVFRCYHRQDKSTALVRTIAICFGLPMLFGVERGQLAILCFTFFVMAHGKISKSARWRWLSTAIAINFKPYLLLTILPQFLRRRWPAVEGIVVAIIVVYLLSYALFGVGTPGEIVSNILSFNDLPNDVKFDNVYYQSTYKAIVDVLAARIPLMHYVGSRYLDNLAFILPLVMRVGQVGIAICLTGSLFKPLTIPIYRLTAMCVALTTTAFISGGYSEIFFFFLVFMEPWRGVPQIIALVSAYVLSISWDYQFMSIVHQFVLSYLTNRYIGFDLGVTVGEFVRPGLILVIEYALVVASLMDLFRGKALKATIQ